MGCLRSPLNATMAHAAAPQLNGNLPQKREGGFPSKPAEARSIHMTQAVLPPLGAGTQRAPDLLAQIAQA